MSRGSLILVQNVPCSGVKMCGDKGVSATKIFDPITLHDAKVITFQALLNGALITDVVIKIYGSLEGGESAPDTLASLTPVSASKIVHVVDKAYDRFWAECSTYTAAGKGSQILMSAR